MEINSINTFCSMNLSGLRLVEYAPLPHIDVASWERFRNTQNNQQAAVPFLAGRIWLQISLLPAGKLWSENSSRTLQGPVYEQRVAGRTPQLSPAVTGTLAKMEKAAFVLRITDRNGRPWLIGDPEEPMYFSASADTADERGLNAYDISFARQTSRRAAGYTPAF